MGTLVIGLIMVVLGLVAGGTALGAARRSSPVAASVVPGAVVTGALLVVAGAVFALVASDEALEDADAPVLGALIALRSPGLTATAETISLIGGTIVTAGLGVVSAVVLFVLGRRRWAAIWVAGVALGALTVRAIKVAAERPRPPVGERLTVETGASLPSGHSLMAALGLGLTAAAVVALGRGAWRVVVAILAVAAVLAIGLSRAYLGVHWTTDVLTGWLLGTAVATACLTLARALDARDAHSRDPPSPPDPADDHVL